jgi:hypothetical protein
MSGMERTDASILDMEADELDNSDNANNCDVGFDDTKEGTASQEPVPGRWDDQQWADELSNQYSLTSKGFQKSSN